MIVLFSGFPRRTETRLNDIFWDVMSFAKIELGHNTKYLDPVNVRRQMRETDVFVVFPEFAMNRVAMVVARRLGVPVIELRTSPMSRVLSELQASLLEIESKKA